MTCDLGVALGAVQVYVERLVKLAYENWENVVEYEGEALLGMRIVPATAAGPIPAPGPGQGQGQGQVPVPQEGSAEEMIRPKVEQQQLGTDTNSMVSRGPSGTFSWGTWLSCQPGWPLSDPSSRIMAPGWRSGFLH